MADTIRQREARPTTTEATRTKMRALDNKIQTMRHPLEDQSSAAVSERGDLRLSEPENVRREEAAVAELFSSLQDRALSASAYDAPLSSWRWIWVRSSSRMYRSWSEYWASRL